MKHNVNTGFKLIFIFALLFLISMWISLGACDNSLIDLVEKDIIGGVSEISIKKGITDIPSGSIEDIGSAEVDQPGDPKIETFTVLNTGSGYLELTGSPIIIIDTANSNEFNIGIPPNSTIAPGTNSTFTIEFTPEDSAGVRSAILSIDNNDSDENPYTFFLAAIATLVPDPPEAPTGMSAGVVSSDQINVSWSDNSDNEDSFVLERRVGLVGDYEPVPESPLASNTTYCNFAN